ncbi:radical SAM protein [Actinoplanes sp. NBRC 103695]|uniref:radical SAM protein n=1 Tax=Actinoplanes sp. NBRC 103695 TaxID=3032202 RepID=UPI0024A2BE06|nr:radical SAM protein [Actinoplanes sp. NBRC 103695]GLZ00667.1 heme d1 biosynthesis radical SAM protein NirJ2 [Actinoplanes sp. NBRC 103695]
MPVIVSPQEDIYVAVRPGAQAGMQLPTSHYDQVAQAVFGGAPLPEWFIDAARQAWQTDLAGQPATDAVLVRQRSTAPVIYSRATWEINKGCNFSCEHCYLEQRPFAGLPLAEKLRLIDMLAEIGVLWFQITGGEPLIDPHFPPSYLRAHDAGMMIEILTNGSRLAREPMITLFAAARPHKITVSMYGASPETADALTQTRGAFNNAYCGLLAAKDADLPIEVTIIVTKHNVDELADMRALIDELGFPRNEYGSISPTYTGSGSPLAAQAPGWLNKSAIFDGCPAGHTFFHVDPHGMATMCKVGRDNPISLITDGPEGLLRLPAIADAQMLRTGGCTGCTLSSSCRVCRPMARVYQEAKAPLQNYCRHGERTPS